MDDFYPPCPAFRTFFVLLRLIFTTPKPYRYGTGKQIQSYRHRAEVVPVLAGPPVVSLHPGRARAVHGRHPPPNVTGVLHMGHMLNNTIQDVLVRRARMMGKNACWVPGTDHASIATEAKVVGKLAEQGIRKSPTSPARSSSSTPGRGPRSTAASSSSSCAGWARRATGTARPSPWTRRAAAASSTCSATSTAKASSTGACAW